MDFSQIGNWFKNTGNTIGNKLKTGYKTYSPKVGNFLSQNKDTLIGGLGGGILGALNQGNQKNLIKASYYKNPYLTSALTPEYSLSDNINNLMGMFGMYGGGSNGTNQKGNLFGNLFKRKTVTINPQEMQEDLDYKLDSLGGQGVLMSGDDQQPFVSPIKKEEDDYYFA